MNIVLILFFIYVLTFVAIVVLYRLGHLWDEEWKILALIPFVSTSALVLCLCGDFLTYVRDSKIAQWYDRIFGQ